MFIRIFPLIGFLYLFSSLVPVSPAWGNEPVPWIFKKLYREMERQIVRAQELIDELPDQGKPLVYSVELLTANGHRGEDLLNKGGMEGNILYLDALKEMGVNGIQISLEYPILLEEFPRHEEYLKFYKKLTDEARRRGMKVLIKTSPLFPDPNFSSGMEVDYTGITLESFRDGMRRQAQLIIDQLKPDYLTVLVEAKTAAFNTGLKELGQPAIYAQTVDAIIDGTDPGPVAMGAGVGSWEGRPFVEELSKAPNIDFIDMHIYPLEMKRHNFLKDAIDGIRSARARGKRVVIGECWLYKAAPGELKRRGGVGEIDRFLRRDNFSFWAPLDARYLELMVDLARAEGVEMVSPFWSKFFFGYVDYQPEHLHMPYRQLTQQSNRIAASHLKPVTLTMAGEQYQQLIEDDKQR